jgi:hypothetical protein
LQKFNNLCVAKTFIFATCTGRSVAKKFWDTGARIHKVCVYKEAAIAVKTGVLAQTGEALA